MSDYTKLRELAEKAAHNLSNEKCIECGFNHNSYRHSYECSEPEYLFRNTASPEALLTILAENERYEKALVLYSDKDNFHDGTMDHDNFGDTARDALKCDNEKD